MFYARLEITGDFHVFLINQLANKYLLIITHEFITVTS